MLTFGNALKLRRGGEWVGGGGGWPTHYVEIEIPAANLGDDLVNFQVYVDLADMPTGFWAKAQGDGRDIVVTNAAGTHQLPSELVGIDTGAETGELHFLAAALSDSVDNAFRIYYGGAPSIPLRPPVSAVWPDCLFVSHDGGITDSSGNGNATPGGGVTSGGIAGKMGAATLYDGTDDFVTRAIAGAARLGGGVTISAWAALTDTAQAGGYLCTLNTAGGADQVAALIFGFNALQWETFGFGGAGTNVTWSRNAIATLSGGDTGWHRIVGRHNNTNLRAGLDGSGAVNVSDNANHSVVALMYWGRGETAAQELAVSIDEIRVRPGQLPDAFDAAEFANQDDPSSFYSIGSEQSA